jgi:hypothetical protein
MVCVFVNILMGYLPSSLPHLLDLKLVIQGSPMLHHRTSPLDSVLTIPVARDPAVVEKLVTQGFPTLCHGTSPPDNVLTIPMARDPAVVEKLVMERTKGIFGPDDVLTVVSDIASYCYSE